MANLWHSGTISIPDGVYEYTVTGLALPFAPVGVSVNVRKPAAESPNITATVAGELSDDGFSVELSTETDSIGYQLDWIAWGEAIPLDSFDTMQVSYADLCETVARYLGYDPDNLAADQVAEVDGYVQAGVRNFYFPQAVNGMEAGYEWSFMRPIATLETIPGVSIVPLPADLGRVIGDLHFDPSKQFSSPVVQVSEHRLHSLAQARPETGIPQCFAVRFKRLYGLHGQIQELVLWPAPVAAYVLTYRYEAYSGKLSIQNPAPLGGARFSEVITESCLAIAEQRANDEQGLHSQQFTALLVAGIEMDRRNSARYYGQMGAVSHDGMRSCGRIRPGVLYNGNPI